MSRSIRFLVLPFQEEATQDICLNSEGRFIRLVDYEYPKGNAEECTTLQAKKTAITLVLNLLYLPANRPLDKRPS